VRREVVGVVLGAGDGERMGGSKALLVVDGEPLAVAHARALREGGCGRVVVVVRPAVLPQLKMSPDVTGTDLVASSAPDQAGSLAIAIRDGNVPADAVVVITPVDAAPASKATLDLLMGALDGAKLDAVTACHEGEGGHPIICVGTLLEPYRRAPPFPPLRDVLRGLGDRRARVETGDPRVLVDLDTPADVVSFTTSAR
jgi:CTP:molybdopterin cytidylyltransferase MocA